MWMLIQRLYYYLFPEITTYKLLATFSAHIIPEQLISVETSNNPNPVILTWKDLATICWIFGSTSVGQHQITNIDQENNSHTLTLILHVEGLATKEAWLNASAIDQINSNLTAGIKLLAVQELEN